MTALLLYHSMQMRTRTKTMTQTMQAGAQQKDRCGYQAAQLDSLALARKT